MFKVTPTGLSLAMIVILGDIVYVIDTFGASGARYKLHQVFLEDATAILVGGGSQVGSVAYSQLGREAGTAALTTPLRTDSHSITSSPFSSSPVFGIYSIAHGGIPQRRLLY